MNWLLIVLTIIILFLTLTIGIDIKVTYNLLENLGHVKITILRFITIFNSNVTFVGDYINFSNKKAKEIKIKLDINDVNIKFINELQDYLRGKILLDKVSLNTQLCLDNPHIVSMVSAILNIITSLYFIKLRQNNNDVTIDYVVSTGYRHNIIKINFRIVFIITVYDLIWSLIRTSVVVRRENEKQKQPIREG